MSPNIDLFHLERANEKRKRRRLDDTRKILQSFFPSKKYLLSRLRPTVIIIFLKIFLIFLFQLLILSRLHPYTYIDRQRADSFYRRLQTLLPGCEAPIWAQQQRRVPDVDLESLMISAGAYSQVQQEATPSPHYNTPNYFVIQHFFNNRHNFGFYGSRIFYNEEPRGDFWGTGYYSKSDLESIDSWYAGDKSVILHRLMSMNEDERKATSASLEKWKKNIDVYFPETKNIRVEPTTHKFQKEPYSCRDLDGLRDKVFVQKYVNAMKNNSFTENELSQIKEVFMASVDSHFFEMSDQDDQYHPTELYKKFTHVFDLPDLFSCTNKSGKLPENQFLDKTDLKWNLNFNTTALARESYELLLTNYDENNDFLNKISTLPEGDRVRNLRTNQRRN